MSAPEEALIDALVAEAKPVRPLPHPAARALAALGAAALFGSIAVLLWGDADMLMTRYAGRELLMALESAAMLLTGVLAVAAAFILSVPGRSPAWALAPLPPLMLWLLLGGWGCLLGGLGPEADTEHNSLDCLVFITAVGVGAGAVLFWLLARARPIEPLRVAMLGGLGAAALAALLLQFFHRFAVSFVDLAIHFTAVGLVVALAALLHRRALRPA